MKLSNLLIAVAAWAVLRWRCDSTLPGTSAITARNRFPIGGRGARTELNAAIGMLLHVGLVIALESISERCVAAGD